MPRHPRTLPTGSDHQVVAVELPIAVPVAFCEVRIFSDTVFVFTGVQYLDEVRRIEMPIQIGIADQSGLFDGVQFADVDRQELPMFETFQLDASLSES